MQPKLKLYLIGAFDRNNYGDLLFPVLIDTYLKKLHLQYEIYHVGLASMDMKPWVNYDTISMKEAFAHKTPSINIAIIVGGEVLNTDFLLMYLCLYKNKCMSLLYQFLKHIKCISIANQIGKILLGYHHAFPWIISPHNFKNQIHIIYNAVGGHPLEYQLKESIQKLSQAKSISIRDKNSYNYLFPLLKNHSCFKLLPDSACALSHILPLDTLAHYISEVSKPYFNHSHRKYFVFQTNLMLSKNVFPEIITALDEIATTTKMDIVLLPIGYAPFHDDPIALTHISKHLKSNHTLILNNNIYDTMTIIGNSNFFLGTSLHGCITALSYNIPFLGLNESNQKLKIYLDTWIDDSINMTSFETMFRHTLDKLTMASKSQCLPHKSVSLALENFKLIENCITGLL